MKNDFNETDFEKLLSDGMITYVKNDNPDCYFDNPEFSRLIAQKDDMYQGILNKAIKKEKSRKRIKLCKIMPLAACFACIFAIAVIQVSAGRDITNIKLFTSYEDRTSMHEYTVRVSQYRYSDIVNFFNKDKLIVLTDRKSILREIVDTRDYVVLNYDYGESQIKILETKRADEESANSIEGAEYMVMNIPALLVESTTESGSALIEIYWETDAMEYELSVDGSKDDAIEILKNLEFYIK